MEKVGLTSVVQETLMIPLLGRAMESEDKKPRFKDEYAVEMIKKLDYDFTPLRKRMIRLMRKAVTARTVIYDEEVKNFFDINNGGVCINIGCGLDTRYLRLKPRNAKWYNVDFPEVIELREKLIKEDENVINIAKSALDFSWMEQVEADGERVLILLEGILMYFRENEVRELFNKIMEKFPHAQVIAEIVSPIVVKMSQDEDTPTDPQFHWGIKKPEELQKLNRFIKIDTAVNTMDVLKNWEILFKIANIIPGFKKTYNTIVKMHYERDCEEKSVKTL